MSCLGQRIAAGISLIERSEGSKTASLAEYSVLVDLISEGQLGPHVKEAMKGVCEGLDSSVLSGTNKVASFYDAATSEQGARQARLNQLLRR